MHGSASGVRVDARLPCSIVAHAGSNRARKLQIRVLAGLLSSSCLGPACASGHAYHMTHTPAARTRPACKFERLDGYCRRAPCCMLHTVASNQSRKSQRGRRARICQARSNGCCQVIVFFRRRWRRPRARPQRHKRALLHGPL